MADSDLELDGGEGGGVVLFALPAFPPFVISFFSTQNKGDGPRPSPRFATVMYLVECIIAEVDLN